MSARARSIISLIVGETSRLTKLATAQKCARNQDKSHFLLAQNRDDPQLPGNSSCLNVVASVRQTRAIKKLLLLGIADGVTRPCHQRFLRRRSEKSRRVRRSARATNDALSDQRQASARRFFVRRHLGRLSAAQAMDAHHQRGSRNCGQI